MRFMVPLVVLSTLILAPPPGAQAVDTGSRDYLVSYGWLTDAYNYQNTGFIGSGTYDCDFIEQYVWPLVGHDVGCFGGTLVYTSEAWALYAPGTTFAQIDDQGVALYPIHVLTIQDALSGPNVMGAACNYNPIRNHNDNAYQCDSGEVDGVADSFVFGCGITLLADATDIHEGNFWTAAFVFTIGVEVTTSSVCIGTTGTTSVVYA